MTVSDPLLKELKGCVAKILEDSRNESYITDRSLSLQPLCETLELIFLKGLCGNFSLRRSDEAWFWMENIASPRFETSYSYTSSVDKAKENCKVITPRGKFRLLVRLCLVQGCLHDPVNALVHMKPSSSHTYNSGSILGDEILGEIFLSVLLQCSKIKFQLQLNNASFLDETWQLGRFEKLEFVPCKNLGICIGFVLGKATVVHVDPAGVAAEDEKVQIGDVIDEINGNAMTAQMRGKLSGIMRQAAGKPVALALVKVRYEDGIIYPPLKKLHSRLGLSLKNIDSSCGIEKNPTVDNEYKAGFAVDYAGEVVIGKKGDVTQIAGAILKVFPGERKPIQLEILEMGVKISERSTGKVIMKHSYMEISSCGRHERYPYLFAYVAGDCSCNMASEFTCYVFHSINNEQIVNILHSIAQGFQRTHWAV